MRKIKRIIRRLRPSRGTYSYECQVGPMVVLWYHDEGMCAVRHYGWSCTRGIGRLRLWRDKSWLY
jgi:hypothetical protein